MRAIRLSSVLLSVLFCSPAWAQNPGVHLGAGLGYARVFQAGGLSFSAVAERPIAPRSSKVLQAIGGSFWYAHTNVASDPEDPEGRHIWGVGVRYRMGLGPSLGGLYLAVPIQLLHSSIPDRATLQPSVGRLNVPEPPPDPPAEDRTGSAWGWGAGLELGLSVGLDRRLSAHTSVQGLYQDIYAESRSHGAWNWHAGLTYHFAAE